MTESYRDQVVIEMRENPDHTKVLDGYRIVIQPNGTIDLDWLNDTLEAMFHSVDENGAVVQTPDVQSPYMLVQRRSETHWGAAGAQAQFLIETAAHISSTGLDTIIGIAIGSLISELRQRGHTVRHGKLEELDQDDIVAHGLRAIETRFGIPQSNLRHRSDGTDQTGQYIVTAVDNDGVTYEVTFIVRGGRTEVGKSLRTMP
ncbi:hypothetical protein [Gordonia hankookensis]|uniref:Uncharacterized protein n=1 Tax=Gordonia hankookensis TaxID=589403 RepID=A0ABR7W6A2_9ACTN|nr:hypothetical protein [Gordonia hankookensis]MBD1318001.1 hypothetical protein [Gordonia hankookensis]